jgi:glycosyltransferase involved in cell wall biosynthesis
VRSILTGGIVLPGGSKIRVLRPRTQSSYTPTVSVIIPCYNYGSYLHDCVKSVLGQERVRVDVLIIDDSSPDGSAEVARHLSKQDARINVICHAINQGVVATVSEGLAQASGDYTAILSADDALTPGCLARATSLMEAHPSVGLAYGFPITFTGSELPPAHTVAASWVVWRGEDWIRQVCKLGRNVILSPEAVIRTSALREIGKVHADLSHTADFETWMQLAAVSDVGYVARADQAYYRIHPENMHNSFDWRADMSERLKAFDIFFTECSERLSDAHSMRRIAHRTIAREALSHAMRASMDGVDNRQSVDEYVAFAFNAWPDSRSLPEWRILSRIGKMRDSRLRQHPSFAALAATRKFRSSLLWRRWKWIGV